MIDKEMMLRARKIAAEYKDPSGIITIPKIAYFQRKLQIGYIRASEIHYALYGAKKQTNGDRIRAMSNEGLGRWIAAHGNECKGDPADEMDCDNHNCEKCWLYWLNSPAESEG